MTANITVFSAKKIITMNPSNPEGTHVAVRDGRILGVGTLKELAGWGEYGLDDTFKDKVLIPGFIEAHGHIGEGGLWASAPYLGYFDRTAPDGTHVPRAKSVAAVIQRLKELDAQMDDPDAPLLAWGFDPIYFPKGTRFYAAELDQVSTSRPIFLLHMSGHVATVNSALMQKEGISADLDIDGLVKGDDGQPLGELQTHAVMALAREAFVKLLSNVRSAKAIENFGRLALRAGHTTVAELGTVPVHDGEQFAIWHRLVDDPDYPVRVVPYFGPGSFGAPADPAEVVSIVRAGQAQDTDKLRIGGIKIWVDGSIQGFTARILWPEYYNGIENGLWYLPPEKLKEFIKAYHREGLNCHIHTNGSQATELLIDAVDEALREYAWLDHRHTAQHVQLCTSAQLRRMRNLGMCANFFVNHVYYYGDQHYEMILGPDRANQIDPCGAAKREGVSFSFHADPPVSPIGHLHTMWCAVNRLTPKGRVLGEHEKISAYDALYAATVDAAYQIHMDHEIGSIEVGKRADFTVLDESPLDVAPMAIKDIPIWGTVLGGIKFPVA
jgi:predicted amidohydrolase YtcJ